MLLNILVETMILSTFSFFLMNRNIINVFTVFTFDQCNATLLNMFFCMLVYIFVGYAELKYKPRILNVEHYVYFSVSSALYL